MSESYSTINPCNMCMPMGSVLAFRGIEGCMPLFHGSQGCATYMRLYLAHHFREPVDIASSALSEKGTVYGGSANLKMGLKNLIAGYSPKAIGVATTCLAETIGDDIVQIIKEFRIEEASSSSLPIIPVSTPSYSASHEEGYARAVHALVQALARRTEPSDRANLVIGSVISPADVRYLKDMLVDWGSADGFILLPDISETLDAPRVENPPRITEGGTPLQDVVDTANSCHTLTIGGRFQSTSAGMLLEKDFAVPHTLLPLPIGLADTDHFVSRMEELTGIGLPGKYEVQRGRLLDTLADVHKYLAGIRVAVYGDSDLALGLTRFLCEAGAIPAIVATGSCSSRFEAEVSAASEDARILLGADFSQIHDEIRKGRIDLMLGTSSGRQISRKEGIPLVRVGLPNHDRVGATRQLLVGYEGAALLADIITNALLEEDSRSIS
jgi:nitrogenase molybdenum-iron protein NifN